MVAAERISTAAFCSFPGRAVLQAVNAACNETEEWSAGKRHRWTKKGPAGQRQLRELDPAQAYGHRPQQEDVWCLSPYEFSMYWDCVPGPMTLPLTRSEFTLQPAKHWDVTVTAKGEAKFAAAKSDEASVRLLPGVDFQRRERGAADKKGFLRQQRWAGVAARMVFVSAFEAAVPAAGTIHRFPVNGVKNQNGTQS